MTQLSENHQFEIEMMRYKSLIAYAVLLVIMLIAIAVVITVADVEKTRIKAEVPVSTNWKAGIDESGDLMPLIRDGLIVRDNAIIVVE